jgi:hypothetical protein
MQYQFKSVLNAQKPLITLTVLLLITISLISPKMAVCQDNGSAIIQIVYTSDAHYALTRKKFQGDTNVSAHMVNAAMIRKINSVPGLTLPEDKGVSSGEKAGPVDYLIQTGDIANRMEIPYQSAAASWSQFETDYIHGVTLRDHQHKPVKLLLAPGNHDITNAIGSAKLMNPKTDPTVMVKIYNLMIKPAEPITNDNYNYANDKINYSLNMKGIHVMFITLWPDSAERIWMQKDLDTVDKTTPVIIFCHDQPTCEAKHFTNPVSPYNMTGTNKFENLTAEHYKEGIVAASDNGATDIEQRGWVKFIKAHANIKAYFHGNSNWNEFYTYKGPDNDVDLKVFRVDSPMKGDVSANDETKLSFQLITMDTKKQIMSVRECLWNTTPSDTAQKPVFGESMTVSLKVNK